ncbi:MAG: hypothetical protein IJC15_02955, partial [Clostridia bacterium]|nr:hypothetical protein [Clostridia bacterium]
MKRITSCLLVAFLLLSLVPLQVMAADEAVRAELVLENSGQKTFDDRAVYKLQFRLFGEAIGNVAMAYVAIDNSVFEVGTPPTVSFRDADAWMDGATATATVGNTTYLRLEVDRGNTAPLPYSLYTEDSYTNAPAIATVELMLKAGATATANAVRFITALEAAGFNAPSAVFACSGDDFYLYNAVAGAAGEAMAAAVTLQAAAGVLTPKPDSNLTVDTAKGYLTGVKEETTLEALKAQFTNPEATLKAFDKNGIEITDPTQKLGT